MLLRSFYILAKYLTVLLICLWLLGLMLSVAPQDWQVTRTIGLAALVSGVLTAILHFTIPEEARRKISPGLNTFFQLIIVGVIIFILVAIAVPSYRGSSVREYYSITKDDLRSISFALTNYQNQHRAVPPVFSLLTTPIPYLDQVYTDPFSSAKNESYRYFAGDKQWIVYGAGPDRDYDIEPTRDVHSARNLTQSLLNLTYDPTNGMISTGDIWVSGSNR